MTLVMTSLAERLAGTGQDMEYKEELVYNAPAVSHNAVVSMTLKVKGNVPHIIIVPVIVLVIVPQPTMPSNPVFNPLHALLKVPNILVIKLVHILSSKVKDSKPQPKLAKARAQ